HGRAREPERHPEEAAADDSPRAQARAPGRVRAAASRSLLAHLRPQRARPGLTGLSPEALPFDRARVREGLRAPDDLERRGARRRRPDSLLRGSGTPLL